MAENSRTPLYIQIREYMLDNITNNKWPPNKKIPSENELARKFNVSRITVSSAISQLVKEGIIYRIKGKGSFVSENTSGEPKIYQSLPEKNNNSNLIAYLMPRLDNLFTARLLSGIEEEVSKHGYQLLFFKTHDSKEQETKIIKDLLSLNVKGIIIYPTADEDYNEETLKLTLNNFPLVVVDRYLRGVETNCVCSDNVKGTFDAITHLIELGHRKIGFASTSKKFTTSIEDRLIGYEKALAQNHFPIDQRLQFFDFDMEKINTIYKEGKADEESKQEIKTFLIENKELTALFAVNPAIGLTVISAAKELGINIPKDLSLVFFDDYELSALSSIPPTCVRQNEFELGSQAAKLLVSLIENPNQERRKIVLPTNLIVRNSTDIPNVK